ncbi:MAG: hypothetical protein J6T38_01705 [Bacteroidaceae bacterium]|nr:hypothetical protein [Bacteroidaceae bacterium]
MSVKYQINEQYAAMQEVQDFVTHLPALFEAEGKQLFANGRNVLKVFEVVKGHPVLGKVVVKRFHARNIFQTIAYSTFTTSKAQRAFHNGLKLLECGLSTPEPIAYVEERNGEMLRYCYYLTAFTEAKSVRTALDVDFNKPMAKSFAQFIAQLHQHGLVHHDLNFDNVLYQEPSARRSQTSNLKPQTSNLIISVIDINRLTVHPANQLTLADCKDDFVRWTDRKDLLKYVVEEYAKARGLDLPSTLDEVMRLKAIHDRNWHRRKNWTHKLKHL